MTATSAILISVIGGFQKVSRCSGTTSAVAGLAALAVMVGACGRPAPEIAAADAIDATSPAAAGVRAVSADSVVPPSSTLPPPVTEAPTVTSSPGTTYVVESGDTLSVIAENFGLTVSELSEANNITDVDTIKPGQELIIPAR